jgi:hypothetical protein
MMNWATSAQTRKTTAVSLRRLSATHWVVGERIVDLGVSSITSTINKIRSLPGPSAHHRRDVRDT